MALPDSTWRDHRLHVGSIYEARRAFSGLSGREFVEGKCYALRYVGYSRYDDSTVFRFQAEGDEPIEWWWHDEEPDDLCDVRFRLVAEAAGY